MASLDHPLEDRDVGYVTKGEAELWMALIHGSRGPIYFVLHLAPKFNEHAVLDEGRELEIRDGRFADDFPAYGVRLDRFPAGNPSRER